ncbi:MAG: HNH endonuclease [Ilumatobacteraceae bacterium]
MTVPLGDGRFSIPWDSTAIPSWTRAVDGARTPSGAPPVFRSTTHAWIALRLVYLADVAHLPPEEVAAATARYLHAWDTYVHLLEEIRRISAQADEDIRVAAAQWNSIDQVAANDAVTAMQCEREPYPTWNLATVALRHFGLGPAPSISMEERDRKLSPLDNQAAWNASLGGRCRSCGVVTISQGQHDRLRKVLRTHPTLFDLTPSYPQKSGTVAPLWSSRLLIASKGVADHVSPWSSGGRTSADNMANLCAACNYSRSNTSLDVTRVAAYS